MSTSTSVHVGPYLVCKRKTIQTDIENRECSFNPVHSIPERGDFCPNCGSPVITRLIPEESTHSFNDMIYAEGERTDDEEEIGSYFTSINGEWIGDDSGEFDYLIVDKNSLCIDGDDAGINEYSKEQFQNLNKEPDQKMVDLLQKVMGYESIKLKFGALVSIA